MPESSNASGQGQQSAGRGVRVVPVVSFLKIIGQPKIILKFYTLINYLDQVDLVVKHKI